MEQSLSDDEREVDRYFFGPWTRSSSGSSSFKAEYRVEGSTVGTTWTVEEG
jgi:hypothetical protein